MKNGIAPALCALVVMTACTSQRRYQSEEIITEDAMEETSGLFDDTTISIRLIFADSMPVHTTPRNRFLVLDLDLNLTDQLALPVGSDFWDFNQHGRSEIVDTLEFHY